MVAGEENRGCCGRELLHCEFGAGRCEGVAAAFMGRLLVLSVWVEELLPRSSLRTTLASEYQQVQSINAFEVYVLGSSSIHLSRNAVKVYVPR